MSIANNYGEPKRPKQKTDLLTCVIDYSDRHKNVSDVTAAVGQAKRWREEDESKK